MLTWGPCTECQRLVTVDLRHTALARICAEAFAKCQHLSKVLLPECLLRIQQGAFANPDSSFPRLRATCCRGPQEAVCAATLRAYTFRFTLIRQIATSREPLCTDRVKPTMGSRSQLAGSLAGTLVLSCQPCTKCTANTAPNRFHMGIARLSACQGTMARCPNTMFAQLCATSMLCPTLLAKF